MFPSDKRICASCVSDKYLRAEIAKSPIMDQACDYCETVCPTIDMDNLADRCNSVIESFYESSGLTDAVVIYGRTPEGEDLVGILDQILGSSQEVIDDLVELLTDLWFDYSSHEHHYGEDPWFVEKTKLSEPLSDAWNKMEHSLKNEARYINPIAASMLESVFGRVHDDRTNNGNSVILELGPDCQIDTLYRARVFQTLESMEIALSHPERHIGPPPSGICAAGRMNAKGVSVFYGATRKETALSEVRPPVGSHVVVVAFKVIRKLRVLDLHQLDSITLKPNSSLFDPATIKEASRCDFLKILMQKMVMPVMPELVEQGYLITQAIADFLSMHPGLNLDGILFPSAQSTIASRDTSGCNVVLFNKSSLVLNAEAHFVSKTTVNLWEYDEDLGGRIFKPEIWTDEAQQKEAESTFNTPIWFNQALIKPTLELDRNSIEINEIKGVSYQLDKHQVEHQYIASPKKLTNVDDFFDPFIQTH